MKILAVAGGSGCGKTFFTNLLVNRLKETVVLPLDNYYHDRPDGIPIDLYNFDSPKAFDINLYRQHIEELSSGKTVQMPNFCYASGKRFEFGTHLQMSQDDKRQAIDQSCRLDRGTEEKF